MAGTTGTHPDGAVPATAAQATLALDTIEGALLEAGATLDDVVAARIYVTDVGEWDEVMPAVRARLGTARPALTMLQIARLLLEAHRVEIEVEAVIGSAD